MFVNDPLSDLIARIKNAAERKRSKVSTPASKLRGRVLDGLQNEGYIRGYALVEEPGKHPEFEIELKYFDASGKLPVLGCVRAAESELAASPKPRGYLPIDGIAAYDKAVQGLVFGEALFTFLQQYLGLLDGFFVERLDPRGAEFQLALDGCMGKRLEHLMRVVVAMLIHEDADPVLALDQRGGGICGGVVVAARSATGGGAGVPSGRPGDGALARPQQHDRGTDPEGAARPAAPRQGWAAP